MSSQDDLAIILVAYGSLSTQAWTTYDKIKATYELEFPDSKIEIAFTAGFIRRRLEKEGDEGVFFQSPLTALARLQDSGCKDVVVQSLHVVPGGEFHQVASLVRGLRSVGGKFGFQNLVIGMPLLASREDYLKASSALKPHLFARPRDPGEVAVVLVGHGTDHPADSAYARMAWTF